MASTSRIIRSAGNTGDFLGQAVNVYATLSGVDRERERMDLARRQDARAETASELSNQQTQGAIEAQQFGLGEARRTAARQVEGQARDESERAILTEEAARQADELQAGLFNLDVISQYRQDGRDPDAAYPRMTPAQLATVTGDSRLMVNFGSNEPIENPLRAAETLGRWAEDLPRMDEQMGGRPYSIPIANGPYAEVGQSIERFSAKRTEVNEYLSFDLEAGKPVLKQGIVGRAHTAMRDPGRDTVAVMYSVVDPKTGEPLLDASGAKELLVPATKHRTAKAYDTVVELPRNVLIQQAKLASSRNASVVDALKTMTQSQRRKSHLLAVAKNGGSGAKAAMEAAKDIDRAASVAENAGALLTHPTLGDTDKQVLKAIQRGVTEDTLSADAAQKMYDAVVAGLRGAAGDATKHGRKLEEIAASGKAQKDVDAAKAVADEKAKYGGMPKEVQRAADALDKARGRVERVQLELEKNYLPGDDSNALKEARANVEAKEQQLRGLGYNPDTLQKIPPPTSAGRAAIDVMPSNHAPANRPPIDSFGR